jgi:hypothetical protein
MQHREADVGGTLPTNVQATDAVGSQIKVDIVLTTHHMGNFEDLQGWKRRQWNLSQHVTLMFGIGTLRTDSRAYCAGCSTPVAPTDPAPISPTPTAVTRAPLVCKVDCDSVQEAMSVNLRYCQSY